MQKVLNSCAFKWHLSITSIVFSASSRRDCVVAVVLFLHPYAQPSGRSIVRDMAALKEKSELSICVSTHSTQAPNGVSLSRPVRLGTRVRVAFKCRSGEILVLNHLRLQDQTGDKRRPSGSSGGRTRTQAY